MTPTLDITILGKPWKVQFLPKGRFIKKCGEGVIGLCDQYKRRIYLMRKYTDLVVITHELVHAYLDVAGFSATELNQEQCEEIFAELIGQHGWEILSTAGKIYESYQQLKARRQIVR
jgi:hypothetical protein